MESKNLASLDLIQILDRVYPIGTPYFNEVDPRNPNVILGFGTWVARSGFMAGKAASGTFATLGSTGGAETVTLTTAQMPAHSHTTTDRVMRDLGQQNVWGNAFSQPSGYASSAAYEGTSNSGGGGSHPNLPPYTVYAWWVRTA